MRFWSPILLLIGLSGCVSLPSEDLSDGSTPAYDGGAYYAPPRPVDVDVEQRAYAPAYYDYPGYPYYGRYPYFYGGYRNRYGWDRHDHDRGDGHGDDHGISRGGDHDIKGPADRSPEPQPVRGNGHGAVTPRAVPARAAPAAASPRAGPHGRN